MGYTLRAGITTGRIDSDLGTFEIRDRTLECDDYETARLLARNQQYGVSWPDGDPGPPEDEDVDAEVEDVDEAEPEIEDEPASESESEPAVDDESGEDDDTDAEAEAEAEVEEVARDDEGREIFTCAGMDGDCTRRVDEPGGLCWQHED